MQHEIHGASAAHALLPILRMHASLSYVVIIISLLMSSLLGHRPALWIKHKNNGPKPTTRAQYGLVSANECKCNRDQRLNVPSEAKRNSR
jgi:hypothetical protein